MSEVLRTILIVLLAGVAVTTIAIFASWWFEPSRRLRRALRRVLGGLPECEALDVSQGRAAGLDFEGEALAVLWRSGDAGLLYEFHEIEGAELIVDGKVLARARRDEPRRLLDEFNPGSERVTLRLVFADHRFPEFELELFGPGSLLSDAADGVRLGRRWLSHVEAVLKRPRPRPAPALQLEANEPPRRGDADDAEG
ncbi:hypothetical protein [Brevundimonas aveniformis]|uniref:hypothetical protein n=1 Tax=Brevundimonas aveniformis TaxID=370977 RepID=UPI00042186A6|nr:hypothetical protein [Brevundimonas aveniformis]